MWIVIWTIVIALSLVGFAYMSIKILYKGYDELIDMFRILKEKKDKG